MPKRTPTIDGTKPVRILSHMKTPTMKFASTKPSKTENALIQRHLASVASGTAEFVSFEDVCAQLGIVDAKSAARVV